jgi:hypothetical protein
MADGAHHQGMEGVASVSPRQQCATSVLSPYSCSGGHLLGRIPTGAGPTIRVRVIHDHVPLAAKQAVAAAAQGKYGPANSRQPHSQWASSSGCSSSSGSGEPANGSTAGEAQREACLASVPAASACGSVGHWAGPWGASMGSSTAPEGCLLVPEGLPASMSCTAAAAPPWDRWTVPEEGACALPPAPGQAQADAPKSTTEPHTDAPRGGVAHGEARRTSSRLSMCSLTSSHSLLEGSPTEAVPVGGAGAVGARPRGGPGREGGAATFGAPSHQPSPQTPPPKPNPTPGPPRAHLCSHPATQGRPLGRGRASLDVPRPAPPWGSSGGGSQGRQRRSLEGDRPMGSTTMLQPHHGASSLLLQSYRNSYSHKLLGLTHVSHQISSPRPLLQPQTHVTSDAAGGQAEPCAPPVVAPFFLAFGAAQHIPGPGSLLDLGKASTPRGWGNVQEATDDREHDSGIVFL